MMYDPFVSNNFDSEQLKWAQNTNSVMGGAMPNIDRPDHNAGRRYPRDRNVTFNRGSIGK
jgi:hypothetical protein